MLRKQFSGLRYPVSLCFGYVIVIASVVIFSRSEIKCINVRGLLATHLLITSTPSIMKMDVAPVSAMAWSRAIVTALMT